MSSWGIFSCSSRMAGRAKSARHDSGMMCGPEAVCRKRSSINRRPLTVHSSAGAGKNEDADAARFSVVDMTVLLVEASSVQGKILSQLRKRAVSTTRAVCSGRTERFPCAMRAAMSTMLRTMAPRPLRVCACSSAGGTETPPATRSSDRSCSSAVTACFTRCRSPRTNTANASCSRSEYAEDGARGPPCCSDKCRRRFLRVEPNCETCHSLDISAWTAGSRIEATGSPIATAAPGDEIASFPGGRLVPTDVLLTGTLVSSDPRIFICTRAATTRGTLLTTGAPPGSAPPPLFEDVDSAPVSEETELEDVRKWTSSRRCGNVGDSFTSSFGLAGEVRRFLFRTGGGRVRPSASPWTLESSLMSAA